MPSANVQIPVMRMMRDVTMTVSLTGLRVYGWRVWFATLAIRVASMFLGCGLRLQSADSETDEAK